MTREEAIHKLVKLKELAERGEENERTVAVNIMDNIMLRWGISIEEVTDDTAKPPIKRISKFNSRLKGLHSRICELKRYALWKLKDTTVTAHLASAERSLEVALEHVERVQLRKSGFITERVSLNTMRRKYL